MKDSIQQLEIYREFDDTQNNIFISATAGSGKTTTLVNLSKRIPSYKKVIFLAFNKSIVEELRERLNENIDVSTIHSIAYKILRANFRMNVKLYELKNWVNCKKVITRKFDNEGQKNNYFFIVSDIVNLMKLNLVPSYEEEKIANLCDSYGISILNGEISDAIKLYNYSDSINYNQKGVKENIDFTDMLYLTHKYVDRGLYPKYDVVMVDECLPYYMPILLSNGSYKFIGDIVKERLECEVLTYNLETNKQEIKKVVGWKKSVNDKKLLKIKASIKLNNSKSSYVVCTENHRVFTKNRGFVRADNIKEGDIVQLETSAYQTHKYKITKKGSLRLSKEMCLKNKNPDFKGNSFKNNPLFFNKIKGGNGRVNELQNEFLESLKTSTGDNNWKKEFVIITGKGWINKGCPNHYKVDICNDNLKIAIELDGGSHNDIISIRKDNRKDDFLKSKGFFVKRIKNKDLVKNFTNIVNHVLNNDFNFCYDGVNCPIDLVVRSVDEIDNNDNFVYDLTVEDNHNFYANGILVHNCQDINPLQRDIILNLLKPNGRFIAVGDSRQTIYSFQGSNLDSFNYLSNMPNTTNLPLSTTYRCGKKIVEYAQSIFPEIQAYESNEDGLVREGKLKEATEGDFVLCRNNLPLIEAFIYFLREGKKSTIRGKDFQKNLLNLVRKIKTISDLDLIESEKYTSLIDKGIKNPAKNMSFIELQEKIQIIRILNNEFKSLPKAVEVIEDLYQDGSGKGIILSTIHKAKGLEADKVFWLNPELIPSKWAETEMELYSEQCLKFVVATRAKKELIFCNI